MADWQDADRGDPQSDGAMLHRGGSTAPTAPAPDMAAAGMAPWLTLLDLAPVRIWLLDAGHRVRWANRAACAVFGLPLDRILLLSRADFCEAHGVHDMDQRQAALAGGTARWAGWASYPDGTRRYTERSYLPFRGENPGGPLYFEFTIEQTALMHDRERAEAAERRLVEALWALPDGLAIEDTAGRLILCNEPYARTYGLSAAAMTGLSFSECAAMLGPRLLSVGNAGDLPDPATAVERLMRVRRTEEPVHVRAADGREFLVRRATTSDGGRIVLHSDLTALSDPWDILSDVFEACPTPILVADAADLRVRMSNAAARALISVGRPEDPRAWAMDWDDPGQRDAFVAALRRDGRAEGLEARFRRGDGSLV
ncbi:PAS domain-containing protein [Rhodobacter calidifons]|uniref:PAS domain-containing protein n=1 Tax=Rhodobacter calidifons TaxID=2715277 RepID=A0ABX0G8B5_9RHOB|nr:PAS domain-containing protein [Rhodobacter calidifons]NHB77522.1 PAS domain-containing protein [Rhodobacter calidifons]